MKNQYGDMIYRPGEELDFDGLSEDEKTERRAEIEAFFKSQHPDPEDRELTVTVQPHEEIVPDEEDVRIG